MNNVNIKPKRPTTAPVLNTDRVTSKLKQDRNYQPPRIKKPIIQRERTLTRQETIKSTDEYNDDFEDDDEISVK